MSKWLAVGAVVALLTGCNYGNAAFNCSDKSCGGAGRCEPGVNLCSFPDNSCSGGYKFGDLAGDKSGQCVDGQTPDIDAGIIDASNTPPPDALVCYGTGIVKVCFAAAPTLPLALPATIDTSDNVMCAKNVVSGGDNYCVIVATTITIATPVRASGLKPLVLIASDSITSMTDALLDVSSRRVRPVGVPEIGAGGDPTAAGLCSAGKPPVGKGGGAGGSFTGLGGAGGDGDANNGVPGTVVPPPITALRGGCAGQDGSGTPNSKGHGGGAVFLIANTKIEIGGGINAGGEGGGAGKAGKGAGGGGAGGMIGLDAPTITITSSLIANGGGGGEGGSQGGNDGSNGADALGLAAAAGGAGATGSGGDGGAGSSGAAAGAGVPGVNNNGGAAGGGGGGAGLVKAPIAAVGANASPAATP
jgi:hypothetical protein